MDVKVTSKHDRETQLSIIGFLNGKSITYRRTIDHFELMSRERNGAEPLKLAQERLVTHLAENLGRNGMPENCSTCRHCEIKLDEHQNRLEMSHVVGVSIRCDMRGCNEAREQFANNAAKLKKEGKLLVTFDITSDEVTEDRRTINPYGESVPVWRTDKVVHLRNTTPPEHDAPDSVSPIMEKILRRRIAKEQAEIEAAVDLLIEQQQAETISQRYGVQTW